MAIGTSNRIDISMAADVSGGQIAISHDPPFDVFEVKAVTTDGPNGFTTRINEALAQLAGYINAGILPQSRLGNQLANVVLGGFDLRRAGPPAPTGPTLAVDRWCVWGLSGARLGVVMTAPLTAITTSWNTVRTGSEPDAAAIAAGCS